MQGHPSTLQQMAQTDHGKAIIQQQSYLVYQYYVGRACTFDIDTSSGTPIAQFMELQQ